MKKTTEERIDEILESIYINNEEGCKDITRLQLEALVMQAQIEQLQK